MAWRLRQPWWCGGNCGGGSNCSSGGNRGGGSDCRMCAVPEDERSEQEAQTEMKVRGRLKVEAGVVQALEETTVAAAKHELQCWAGLLSGRENSARAPTCTTTLLPYDRMWLQDVFGSAVDVLEKNVNPIVALYEQAKFLHFLLCRHGIEGNKD
jgi:hypothetical protein